MELPRVAETGDLARTFDPPRRLVVARAFVESLRVTPWMVMAVLGVGVLTAFEFIRTDWGAKWLLVGRFRESQHPLWSSFVWRNELFDVFYEELGVPWFGSPCLGTPIFNAWVRTLGAKIGKGVWLESYWLPETDLVRLDDGATVNRGCVLQTHLFHDRLMRISSVHLGRGATLGPRSFVLPGASIGAGARIGPGSLVMRGEAVPGGTRWAGNPIAAEVAGPVPVTGDGADRRRRGVHRRRSRRQPVAARP
jgi:non-ribosomal peptide synthetase-like protein